MKKKIFELRPWRSFSPGIGSARSAPLKNNDDIPTTDTNEIKQLINRVKRGELDQGDELLIEKLLNILLMIVSLLQRKHTSIRRMKEFLLGMKEKKRGKDETKNRAEDRRSGADGSSQTDSPKEMASKSTCEGDSSAQGVKSLKRPGHGRKSSVRSLRAVPDRLRKTITTPDMGSSASRPLHNAASESIPVLKSTGSQASRILS